MQRNSFHIEAWDYEDPVVPLSHRHQLQPLQEIIDKSKLHPTHRRPISLLPVTQPDHSAYEVQDGRSFLSVRLKRNKFRTEETRVREKPTPPRRVPRRVQTQQDETPPRMEGSSFLLKSIISLMEKEPPKLKTPKLVFETKGRDEPIVFPKNKKRSKSTSQRIRSDQNKIKPRSNSKHKVEKDVWPLHVREVREESAKHLKTFFMNTLEGGRQKEHEVRWKNMIEKSNRKKKELESLFKTRMLIGRNEVEHRIVANRIDQMLAAQINKKDKQAKTKRDEFNDSAMFCPWNYNEDKLINHLRAKHQQ